jgi:hypothetical protein
VNNGQGSRPGFQPFKPPPNGSTQARGGNSYQSSGNNKSYGSNNRPAIRYTAPTQAHDSMYDVHAPLNRPEAQAKPAPRQSEGHSSAPHESNRK